MPRALAVVAFGVLSLAAAGCALAHDRVGPPNRPGACDPGAIVRCRECTPASCCLHFCTWDRTWTECAFVANACIDSSAPLSGEPGDAGR